MKFAEIVAKMEELEITPQYLAEDLEYGDDDDYERKDRNEKTKVQLLEDAVGPFKQVYSKGGEGQGEEWFAVTLFEDHDVYIRVDGFYTSYDGTSFDCAEFREVRPQEKTITVYE